MMRLIDADKLSARLRIKFGFGVGADSMQRLIDAAPTIDAKPVKKGIWLRDSEPYAGPDEHGCMRYFCSKCDCCDEHKVGIKVPYCWNCGAEMEDEEDEKNINGGDDS